MHRRPAFFAVCFVVALVAGACGAPGESGFAGGARDAGVAVDGSFAQGDGGLLGDAATHAPSCVAGSTDQGGCACPTAGATQPCYPNDVDPKTRNVGACKDGTQTCIQAGEFSTWSACTGMTVPAAESCAAKTDANCNGAVGCADPACATDASCNTGCTDGQTRKCYTGPAGTENVGTCKDGTQTCKDGKWPADCPGEVLPTAERCADPLDYNCNHLPGCFDVFFCLNDKACNGSCDPAKLDPGCTCPDGTGDTALCPDGTHGVPMSGSIADECCPCKASDCATDTNCCAEAVCAGNAACAAVTCRPLPPSCNGKTNADCDDFPEDCDEPCCKCTACADGG